MLANNFETASNLIVEVERVREEISSLLDFSVRPGTAQYPCEVLSVIRVRAQQ